MAVSESIKKAARVNLQHRPDILEKLDLLDRMGKELRGALETYEKLNSEYLLLVSELFLELGIEVKDENTNG